MTKKLLNVSIVKYPHLETPPIHSYIKYQKPTDSHYFVKCNEVVINQNGIKSSCATKEMREDTFKKWIVKNRHVCIPGDPISQKTLDDFANKQKDSPIITQEEIYAEMAEFTGKMNLSLGTMCSNEFYKLSNKLIAFGSQLTPNQLLQQEKEGRFFEQIKKDKFRHIMIATATAKHTKTMHRFSLFPYVCLAIDEGTTARYKVLHFVLEYPKGSCPSYPCTNVRMTAGKAKDYVISIAKGLNVIRGYKINVGSIVLDGNTAQLKSFNKDWKLSLYHKSIPDIKKIIIVPCLCHRIHNSYKYTVLHNKELSELVTNLHVIASTIHDTVDHFKTICPTHCDNRWIYDYDILEYLMKNKEEVIAILPDTPFEKFLQLYKCLKVLKLLVLKFEKRYTQIQSAFLTIENAIGALLQLGNQQNNPYSKLLAYQLQNYTLQSKDGNIWSLAYCLTPNGREDFRIRNINQANPVLDDYLKFFHIDDDSLLDDDDNLDHHKFDWKNYDELMDSESSDDDYIIAEDTDEFDDDDSSLPDDDQIIVEKNDNFTNYTQCAKECLKTLLQRRGFSTAYANETLKAFNQYIDCIREDLVGFELDKSNYSWVQIRNSIPAMSDIADIAMRLLVSTTSEASCERTIKKQRQIHSPRRLRSKKELIDARMRLSSI